MMRSCFFVSIVSLTTQFIIVASGHGQPTSTITAEKICDKGGQRVRIDSENRIYILNQINNDITVLDTSFNIIKRIGGFGQGPGEFRLPFSFAIDKSNKLYIVDAYNGRIQILSPEGSYLDEFPINKTTRSVTISNRKEIIINDTKNSSIFAIISPNGGKPKFFGEQIVDPELSSVIEAKIKDKIERSAYSRQIRNEYNMAHIQTDQQSNIYAMFFGFPILRKYSSEGRLKDELFLKTLALDPVVLDTRKALLSQVATREVGIRFVLQDFAISNGKEIIITFRNSGGKIIIIDQESQEYSEYTLTDDSRNTINGVGICYAGNASWVVTNQTATYLFEFQMRKSKGDNYTK